MIKLDKDVKKTALIAIISAFILVIFVNFIIIPKLYNKPPVEEEIRVPVKLATVKVGVISKGITFTGTIKSRLKVSVFPKTGGRVARVFVDDGMRVSAGQILAKLEDSELRAQYAQAQAALNAAQTRVAQAQSGYSLSTSTTGAQLQVANTGVAQAKEAVAQAKYSFENTKTDYNRTKGLYAQGAVSKQNLDQITTQFQISKSRLEAAKAQLAQASENVNLARAGTMQNQVRRDDIEVAAAAVNQAQANMNLIQIALSDTEIRSPITGVITGRNADIGEMVSSRDNNPTFTVIDNSVVYLESNVSETEALGMRPGSGVIVTINSMPGREFQGKVETVVPAADPRSRTFRVKVIIPNQEGLLADGMSAVAKANVGQYTGIVIPRHWVKVIEGDFFVVTVNDKNQAVNHRIIPGYYNEEYVLVQQGLNEGDKIICTGQETLKDGELLKIVGVDEPDASPTPMAAGETGQVPDAVMPPPARGEAPEGVQPESQSDMMPPPQEEMMPPSNGGMMPPPDNNRPSQMNPGEPPDVPPAMNAPAPAMKKMPPAVKAQPKEKPAKQPVKPVAKKEAPGKTGGSANAVQQDKNDTSVPAPSAASPEVNNSTEKASENN